MGFVERAELGRSAVGEGWSSAPTKPQGKGQRSASGWKKCNTARIWEDCAERAFAVRFLSQAKQCSCDGDGGPWIWDQLEGRVILGSAGSRSLRCLIHMWTIRDCICFDELNRCFVVHTTIFARAHHLSCGAAPVAGCPAATDVWARRRRYRREGVAALPIMRVGSLYLCTDAGARIRIQDNGMANDACPEADGGVRGGTVSALRRASWTS